MITGNRATKARKKVQRHEMAQADLKIQRENLSKRMEEQRKEKEEEKEIRKFEKKEAKEIKEKWKENFNKLTAEKKGKIASMIKDAGKKWSGLTPEQQNKDKFSRTSDADRATIIKNLKKELVEIQGPEYFAEGAEEGTGRIPGKLVSLMEFTGHGFGAEFNANKKLKETEKDQARFSKELAAEEKFVGAVVAATSSKSDGTGGKRRRRRSRRKSRRKSRKSKRRRKRKRTKKKRRKRRSRRRRR